jgi:hypothetical protein
MGIQKQVEQEYGQPFWDVVKGYADDGECVASTAMILGYAGRAPFAELLKRHGAYAWFTPWRGGRRSQPTPEHKEKLRQSMTKARDNNPYYKQIDVEGVVDTVAGHAQRRGLKPNVVYARLWRGDTMKRALR